MSMTSIKEIYKIGRGPSSSHTIGPERACRIFAAANPGAGRFRATLCGSLAKTGKGHGTDAVIRKTFAPVPVDIVFDTSDRTLEHPNTLFLEAFADGKRLDRTRVLSIGGGDIRFDKDYGISVTGDIVYDESRFTPIAAYCRQNSLRLWQYVEQKEGGSLFEYLSDVWKAMKESIKRGLDDEGVLPGGLDIHKKAKQLFESRHIDESAEVRENRLVCSYAFAVSEQNAAGERIVTAPTCGSAGVLPSVLYYYEQKNGFSEREILHALATAGLIGDLIKTNASISGAECGCQAEIGSACAMAAAALAELFELCTDMIEYAAEIAIEHHLGLTCDPIGGLVQIPCIERNAVAAMRAINAVNLSSFLWNTRKISFDRVVDTMRETGRDLPSPYRETSEGGLAKLEL